MKREVDTLSAIPSKQIYRAMINDYDMNLAICELIDNALDIWTMKGRTNKLEITIMLETNQQHITVQDNAGGVQKEDLKYIVSPGLSTSLSSEQIIGVFGVGSKRAVVALSGDIRIKSRFSDSESYLVEFDDKWLEIDNWELPIYEIDPIPENTTIIELQKLRFTIDSKTVNILTKHLGQVYAKFIENLDVEILVNNSLISSEKFDVWSYPPNFEPRKYNFKINKGTDEEIKVNIVAGLSKESSPAGGEYGVYFYCNNRLIVKEQKDHNVGFIKGVAGKAHPSLSLIRVIISLNGPAEIMPWNSSKSQINYNHIVYIVLQESIFELVKYYASLSRRTSGDWPKLVFDHSEGETISIDLETSSVSPTSYLPQLPKTRQTYGEKLKNKNEIIVKKWPWTQGLYETIGAINFIDKQKWTQKNRINLILLDSTLEIAFKEFLINHVKIGLNTFNSIKNNRVEVQKELRKHKTIAKKYWDKVEYYYKIRCDLIHQRATPNVTQEQVYDYREIVELFLRRLFGLDFEI